MQNQAKNRTQLVWDHWHIEVSSICALKCPRCPRAEVSENLLNQQLSLQFFQEQLGPTIIKQIRKITFCGNDGDPIYCKDFLDICAWIKSINNQIQLVIITNGSYKTQQWWNQLANILGKNDEIHWSLDGWDQTSNTQYRVNCDWASIMNGYQSFSKINQDTYRVWAAIAFKFNQHQLEFMKSMAKEFNFDLFQLTKSTKFGENYPEVYGLDDNLCPDNKELVSIGHRFQRSLFTLTNKSRPGQDLKEIFLHRASDLKQKNQYSGICLIGNKGVFLNSQGEFYPCCWTANRYKHNSNWHKLAKINFNLKNKKFYDILEDSFWTTDFLKFDSSECQTKCTQDKLSDVEHTTEW